ncbi:MAG TPA: phospholipase D-like domain-containing protein [Acidimicrobiales bacterium]|nr:phospholipase D-like domain-containing protein [Acidimicrobiales bacterium]
MAPSDWFLSADERGNDATVLDRRHPGGAAWSSGNDVRPLVHGATYFAALAGAVTAMRSGDLVLFADWRGDPDERLEADGPEVEELLCGAAERGVVVRGLVWRSHLDRLQFSASENRHLGERINAAGGVCLLDQRVRPGGSHHQKFVVLRHPGRPTCDVAYVGGIDLCHSRRDDADHRGDPQTQTMAAVYGPTPPWHDVQLEVRGPAVGDVEAVFRERWGDRSPLSLNPVRLVADRLRRADGTDRSLPEQLADPPPCGPHGVQLLRTYPPRRPPYPFAPAGERSVARGIGKALGKARSLVYLEDQYLWSSDVAAGFCDALRRSPELRMVAVIPLHPDQDGRLTLPANLIGRRDAMRMLTRAAPGRVAVYGIENHDGVPVYVHAKVCIVDDDWVSVGSDNVNRRSWTHDSELSCAVVGDGTAASSLARDLRLRLAAEHLDHGPSDLDDLADPAALFAAFAASAAALDAWHAGGRVGARPPGRLRTYGMPRIPVGQRLATRPLYRAVYDPDGRRRPMRAREEF